MSTQKKKQGGKKSRKHGRHLRKPSYKRYLAEKRWLTNKAKKIARMIRKRGWKPQSFRYMNETVKFLVEKILKKKLG